ncbi:hypothetical protein CLV35_0115 [Motilibacter peucedani]|uniref:Uncharacterized protein n=1 Tax=Motilibacter peucedani TaxID=598650 RepID=A0A420XVI2_9ACTN|nr:hypothetical protein [Motilibacter peucedani]RKS84298.1 hypothetical protein CLV35_0115 [Motilibacter peucedani]
MHERPGDSPAPGRLPAGAPSDRPRVERVVALASEVRPSLPLGPAAADALRAAMARQDVWLGGCFAAVPEGAQVWTAPRTDPAAVPLGEVSWSEAPSGGLVITSVSVTPAGLALGEGTLTVLARVLALTGVPVDGTRVGLPVPTEDPPA